MVNYNNHTVKELRAMCRARGITRYSKLRKKELIKLMKKGRERESRKPVRVRKDTCGSGKIRNPASGRCVGKHGKIGREILRRGGAPLPVRMTGKKRPKACGSGKIRNPASGRCVGKHGKIGREILRRGGAPLPVRMTGKKRPKACGSGKIRNPASGRCVGKHGKIGREILRRGTLLKHEDKALSEPEFLGARTAIERDCFLKSYKSKAIPKKRVNILQSSSFTVRYSRLGGIIDIRPKATVNKAKLIKKWSKKVSWDAYGDRAAAAQHLVKGKCSALGPTAQGSRASTVCRTLYPNMVKVKELLRKCGKVSLSLPRHFVTSPPIHVFNVEENYKGYRITSALPEGTDRCVLAVCARGSGGFGHYMLAVLDGSICYFFDSQGGYGNRAVSAKKGLLEQPRIKKLINVYDLDPDCYRTTQHQHNKSTFCSVWSSSLALLLGLNPTKTIKEVFTYFAYKAPSRAYLDEKIRLFAIYLFEKGVSNISASDAEKATDLSLLEPTYKGKLCVSGPPSC